MTPVTRSGRILPVALGVAMVGIIVAAGLSPNTGAVPAQGNCQYGQCVANSGLQWWVFALIAILIVAALGAALILLRRRRPPPGSGVAAPLGPTAGALSRSSPSSGAAPDYMETPEDVSTSPVGASAPASAVPPAAVVGGAAAGAGAAAAEGEPDIDSLMAELDKISGEILKRPKSPVDKNPPANP